MPAPESPEHRRLKRLALVWAQSSGYPIAAEEVTMPHLRFRLDVAAYRPGKSMRTDFDAKRQRRVTRSLAAIGATAIFECKAFRPDYLRDCRSITATTERLRQLTERKAWHEEVLRLHHPSTRNGDSLFPEFETLDFCRPRYTPYLRLLEEIRRHSARLHENTKFDKLTAWRAASLRYLVAEPGIFEVHELPADWGLLIRNGETLELTRRPILHEVDEAARLTLLHRIAMAGTRAINQAREITFEEIDASMRPL
jgi:hypothetical protein